MTETKIPDGINEQICPLCFEKNDCGIAKTGNLNASCWCQSIHIDSSALNQIQNELKGRSCICVKCAEMNDLS